MAEQRRRPSFPALIAVSAIVMIIGPRAVAEGSGFTKEFVNLWMPGLGGDALIAFDSGEIYWGGSFKFDVFYCLDAGRPAASQIDRGRLEVYGVLSLLGGDGADRFLWFYGAGFNMALEGPAILSRDAFIPYIGLELGGFTTDARGTGFAALPLLGIALVSAPRASFCVEGGLFLNTISITDFMGVRARLSLIFAL